MDRKHHLVAQGAAAAVSSEIARLQTKCIEALRVQDEVFARVQSELQKAKDFIGNPQNIQGSLLTKHGEIAERIEIAVTNATDLFKGCIPSAFKDPDRNGPVDYWIARTAVQSKFINGISSELRDIQKHTSTYTSFPGPNGYFHIPKDHYEIIEKLLHGELAGGLSERAANRIIEHVRSIEAKTGRSFSDVVRGSVSAYPEVQRGRAADTMTKWDAKFTSENAAKKEGIVTEHQPGWGTVATAAAEGAAIGGAIRLGAGIWRKAQEGRNVFYNELTLEDWKELGIDTAIGAAQGGVAAGAIFALTQQAGLAAPFAGAFVSTAMGLAALTAEYRSGKITVDEFVELGMLNCFEGAVVGLAAAAGQTLIPIPTIGAMAGALAGRIFVSLGKDWLDAEDSALTERLARMHDECMRGLDQAYRDLVDRIDRQFQKLGELTTIAFDFNLNAELQLAGSINLALAYGVDERRMIHGLSELETYMVS